MTVMPMAATVLLVEDDPGDALLIAEALRALDRPRQVCVVGDGREALDFLLRRGPYAEALRPDLVLLDLQLPGMHGAQVLSAMKTDAALRLIPVVVLSASGDEEDITSSYGHHANAYVTKPDDGDGLAEVVRAIDDLFITVAMRPPHLTTD